MSSFGPTPTDSIRPRLQRHWVLLLTGPVVWSAHFFVVYLFTEAVCGLGDGPPDDRPTATMLFVLTATLVGAVITSWGAVSSWRFWRGSGDDGTLDGFVGMTGTMLGAVFTAAILFVGLPALVLSPC